jgi:hypothetical protein
VTFNGLHIIILFVFYIISTFYSGSQFKEGGEDRIVIDPSDMECGIGK